MNIAARLYVASTERPKTAREEFVRFMLVGIVTTIIDFGLLVLLTEIFSVYYLFSATLGFVFSQTWAYIASVYWVYARFTAGSHANGFPAFLAISATGLLLTVIFLWTMTEQLGVFYFYAKIIASAATSLMMFFVRRKLLFS